MDYSRQELLSMGVIEYAENVLKLKLNHWQKKYLENLQQFPLDADKIFQSSGRLYGPRAVYLVYERWKNRVSDNG